MSDLGKNALLGTRAKLTEMRLETTALLLIDLDEFKQVNDTLGHAAGDALLLEVGDRLGASVRSEDTVVRLGGDEFAILLPDAGQTAASLTAQRVLTQLRRPFTLDSTTVHVGGSIGIALGAADGDLDELLRDADLAMYAAKASGRNQARVFDPQMYPLRASDTWVISGSCRTAGRRRDPCHGAVAGPPAGRRASCRSPAAGRPGSGPGRPWAPRPG